ncbi:hypothetical protein K490DRAFT_34431 [Saccharata proteae CBS 121410]|uniref:Uncharacterized protein n=1 Tax=Saccharata proteae CBS 121410 TaxID=1314787 RepID=A0A9P4I0Z4_9PEZI|nr:hypothetical protein K490DRAFT_34431 [Saccharata proteae CBS 121410]
MQAVFNSDDIKGSFFLISLPDTIDYIINNLSTKDITSFLAIEPKMLDLALKYSLNTCDYSSLIA